MEQALRSLAAFWQHLSKPGARKQADNNRQKCSFPSVRLVEQNRAMAVQQLFGRAAYWLAVGSLYLGGLAGERGLAADRRNFANGWPIPAENYCDQPRLVVTKDGAWVCVLTTGAGNEGEEGQHVVATTSRDKGRSWSPLVAVEPADKEHRSAYALALHTPADRVYAFYCYNGDAVRTLPDGKPIRDDMQGWFCYRFSDDQGTNWSKRYRLPMRLTAADRNNPWQGKLQMFWAVGTPAVFDGKAVFGFTKLGKYILQDGEGWFYRSDNILTEKEPDKIEWQLLPEGDRGVRAPQFGSVQEEFDVVHLEKEDLFCVYRTTLGHACCAYSRDGGHHWGQPEALHYAPGGRIIKQPRACAKIWKTQNGRYLLWFHNNGTTTYNNGLNAGSRNLAWLSAGRLRDGLVHWSQPEIVAYVEGGLEGCSYPDLVEDEGQYYLCATQKTQARVLEVESGLLQGLWEQETNRRLATNGLVLNLEESMCAAGATARGPRLKPLCGDIQRRKSRADEAGSLTLDVGVRFTDLAPGQVILDSRDAADRGYVLRTNDRRGVRFEMCDGWQSAFWDCDQGLLQTNREHQLVVSVDGPAKVICFVVDGALCDGGAERAFGFGRFNPDFKEISGGPAVQVAPALHGKLSHVRIYDRALRTSEAVGNLRAEGR